MSTKSLATLRGELRDAGEWLAPFFPDSWMNTVINHSLAALWDLVLQFDKTRVMRSPTISVVSGTDNYPLPADFYMERGVAVEDSSASDGWRDMERFDWRERHGASPAASKWQTRWNIEEGKLYLSPKPNQAFSVRLEYVCTAPQLTSDSDTVEIYNHWHRWLLADAAIQCCAKEESDPRLWQAELGRCEARIRAASPQVKGEPKAAVSVYDVYGSTVRTSRMGRRP